MLAWPRRGQAAVEVEGVGSFGTSGGHSSVPIASVAKVMTAFLTLREHPLAPGQAGFVLTITRKDVEEEEQRVALDESTLVVRAGERITERQALEGLLLPSANNIAALLAIHDAGGVKRFVGRMNLAAKELGMTSTTYTDPSGFNAKTVSTATDQLKLARVAMRDPTFAAIVDQPSARLPVAGRVINYNGLVGAEGYVGVKTGSDEAAGGCLIFAKRITIARRRLRLLGVVLGQRKGPLVEAALGSAQLLGGSAATAMRVGTLLPAGSPVLSASSADGRRTVAATVGGLKQVGWGGLKVPVEVLARPARTQLQAGEPMATVAVRGARTHAVAADSVGGPSLGWRLLHLF
jgi:serine-type D-Ala-D-Ala carboxypeptidase (penicillin-binding protein 5/6)